MRYYLIKDNDIVVGYLEDEGPSSKENFFEVTREEYIEAGGIPMKDQPAPVEEEEEPSEESEEVTE